MLEKLLGMPLPVGTFHAIMSIWAEAMTELATRVIAARSFMSDSPES
jgi:hypothetical protein